MIGVVIVIAVFVDLQKAADVPVGLFAECAALHAVCFGLFRLVEQIGQRFFCGLTVVQIGHAGGFTRGQDGIAIFQLILYDLGARGGGARICVDRPGLAVSKAKMMVLVDAGIVRSRVASIILGPGCDPVVEQVDLDACGRDGVGHNVAFQLLRCGFGGQSGREQRYKNGQRAEQAERADRMMMLHKITSPDVPMVRRNIDLDFSYILHLRGEKRKEICIF